MSEEYYDCQRLCMANGRLITAERLKRRCALPDINQGCWGPGERPAQHMGGPRDERGHRRGESSDDGCPGSWYRTRYISSLLPYSRMRDANGGLCENPLLTRCEDKRVIEAILYLEGERVRCSNYLDEIRLGR